MSNSDLKVLTEAQVAELLGLRVKTLQSWRWQGQGPAFIKVGRLVRYRASDVDAFLEKNKKAAVA